MSISQQLRQSGINVLTAFGERKFGDQFKQAQKLGIPLYVSIGDSELAAGTAEITIVKVSVPLDLLTDELKQGLV